MSTVHISLAADPTQPQTKVDRREWRRRQCAIGTVGYLNFGDGNSLQETRLMDISEKGIGFLSASPLANGLIMTITLSRHDGNPVSRSATVRRSIKWNQQEWLIGCEFAEWLTTKVVDELT